MAYEIEFRKEVAYEFVSTDLTLKQVAEKFKVTLGSVRNWAQQYFPEQYASSLTYRVQSNKFCGICGKLSTGKHCPTCHSKGWVEARETYGLSYFELVTMPSACEICGSTEKLHIDHDHDTGKYRGILCHHCNVGIGMFDENINKMEKGIKYIKLHRKNIQEKTPE